MEKIKGLVLKSIPYKESSKIIYVYTEEGLISILIHGSNKMKNRYLNLGRNLNYIECHVSGKTLRTFRDGDVLDHYEEIATDLEKYTYVTHLLELVYQFSNHPHDHEKLLQFLLKILAKIKRETIYIPYIYMAELKCLYLLGVNPLFKHCVECQETNHLTFSLEAGGMYCEKHPQVTYAITPIALQTLQILYYFDIATNDLPKISAATSKEIRLFLDAYYAYHLNTKTNARKILTGLIGF